MSEPIPFARFQAATKVYRGFWNRVGLTAVTKANFTVPAGCVFGLLGPNRAGKTTLVKLLLGLCRPTSGGVERFGRPAADRGTLARVGYLHENQHLPRYWTASGLLHYYGTLTRLRGSFLRARVPELLQLVGLADRSQEPISRFSKGMVQRLGLAQALLADPDLLVLDEPAEGLDLEGRHRLYEIVKQRRAAGKTVLLVSHVVPEVEKVCDRLAVIVAGEIVFEGTLETLTRPLQSEPRTLEAALTELYARRPAA